MNRLSPEAQRLFHLAKDADNPDALEVNRVGRALAHRVAKSGGLATGAALLSHAAPASAAFGVSKIVTALLVTGGLCAAGFIAIHSRKQPVTDALQADASSSAALRVLAPVAPSPQPVEPATPSASSFAPINKGHDVPARVINRATNLKPLQDTADQLRAETADLRKAQAALHSGQATLALQLLNAQDTQYRSGLLQQERSGARVLALCQIGSVPAARAESARFEKRWPNSPLIGRVRSACK